jgi:hypothetical protein
MGRVVTKARKLKVPAIRDDVELLAIHRHNPDAAAILELAGDIAAVGRCR